MPKRFCALVTILWLGISPLVALDGAAAQTASVEDEKAVKDAVNQWFVVLNAMLNGDPAPFAAIYSHAEDVTYLGAEGGIHVGWEATYGDWKLQAEKTKGGAVEGADIHVVIVGDMAAAQHYTNGKVTGADGKPQDSSMRETSVFRKEDGQWKMISHHADAFSLWAKVVDRK